MIIFTPRLRWGTGVGAVTLLMLLMFFPLDVSAEELGPVGFSASASTDSLSLELIDTAAPGIPRGKVLYATPTITRVALDSLGNSMGFAAGPHPGDTVTGLMGAVNALGPAPVVPPYPFAVSSRHPGDPENRQANGPHELGAKSTENASSAEAHLGLVRTEDGNAEVASILSRSTVEFNPGVISAAATSTIDGFSVDSVLEIGHVAAHAEVTSEPGQKPTKQTSFALGTITVAGTQIGLTDEGLTAVPGAPVEMDPGAFSDQLSEAGVTLAYLPAEETATSVKSAGLRIGLTQEVPGRSIQVYLTLGRVSAQVAETPSDDLAIAGMDLDTDTGPGVESDFSSPPINLGSDNQGGFGAESPHSATLEVPADVESGKNVSGFAPTRDVVAADRLSDLGSNFYLTMAAAILMVFLASGLIARPKRLPMTASVLGFSTSS